MKREYPELISTLLRMPRERKEIPPHVPCIEKGEIKIPLPYIGYKDLDIDDIEVTEHHMLGNVEKLFQPTKPLGLSYFYPVGRDSVLLRKNVEAWPFNRGYSFLKDSGFEILDEYKLPSLSLHEIKKKIEDAIDEEIGRYRGKLQDACVGIFDVTSEGAGKNFGFCGNIFSDELIEQDKERKANFRLIADLLKYGSEARSYLISAEEMKSIKPEREVDYITCQKCMAKMPLNARYCGKCGAMMPLEAKFCGKCGARLQ